MPFIQTVSYTHLDVYKRQTHPRTRKKLESIGFINSNPMIEFMKPFGFMEYIKLQQNASLIEVS